MSSSKVEDFGLKKVDGRESTDKEEKYMTFANFKRHLDFANEGNMETDDAVHERENKAKIMISKARTCFAVVLAWLVLDLAGADGQPPGLQGTPTVHHVSSPSYAKFKGPRNISIEGNEFVLDGQRLQIVSGSFHYFRTPAVYWRDRLHKLRAAGLNSVSMYVEWSYHEAEERRYDFTGDRDVAHFIRLAAAEGLHVLFRPGPYICAERDLGGLPYWLLSKYPNIRLRTTDKDFMAESKTWMSKLFEQITPLLYGNGGPIILVQVENEYGSYGSDHEYMAQVRDVISPHVGKSALLYTTDGPTSSYFLNGAVNGTLTTIDFGKGYKIPQVFNPLRKYMPQGPLMNSEFYPGWLTHWCESFQRVPTDGVVRTLRDMLDNNINLNFYMFYGGTNFEFSAGANYGGTYQPDITSYDYDAPLTEAGDPTPKYNAIRDTIAQYFPEVKDIPVPVPTPKGAYGKVVLARKLQLLSPEGRNTLGKFYEEYSGITLPTFEKLRQRSGLVLYETTLNKNTSEEILQTKLLTIAKPRDRIYVYIDGKPKGTLSRMHKIYDLPLEVKKGTRLSLLVENQGRINYGSKLHDWKGILGTVVLGGENLEGPWSITGFPLESMNVSTMEKNVDPRSPALYEGDIILPEGVVPLDTFLNPSGWGKGYIWVNGHNLGRYWPSVGPQVTLYVPGAWLRAAPATNRLQILELEYAKPGLDVNLIDHPILEI